MDILEEIPIESCEKEFAECCIVIIMMKRQKAYKITSFYNGLINVT